VSSNSLIQITRLTCSISGWTSCNGPNWVDFLTVEYNASTVLTYNFADGGATIDATLSKPWRPDVLSLIDQVQKRFLRRYAKKPPYAPWTSNNTLFAFWIGINDVGNTYWESNRTRVNSMFLEYASLVEQVYEAGARNFIFLGVPPLQRTPLSSGNAEGVTLEDKAVRAWNSDLIKMSDSLRARHPDITSFIFSTIDVYNKVLDDPLSYPQTRGLKDTKEFCGVYPNIPQGNIDYVVPQGSVKNEEVAGDKGQCKYKDNEYFWYNNMHPTSPIHDATASEVAKLLEGWPSNEGKTCKANEQITKIGSGKSRYHFRRLSPRRHGHRLYEFYES
jgi:phospholipase/lecithinase/hemolysin